MDRFLIIAMEWVALNIVPVKSFIVNTTLKINYPIRTDFYVIRPKSPSAPPMKSRPVNVR